MWLINQMELLVQLLAYKVTQSRIQMHKLVLIHMPFMVWKQWMDPWLLSVTLGKTALQIWKKLMRVKEEEKLVLDLSLKEIILQNANKLQYTQNTKPLPICGWNLK